MGLYDLDYLLNDKTLILDHFESVKENNNIDEFIYIGNSNNIPNFKHYFKNLKYVYTISNSKLEREYILYKKGD